MTSALVINGHAFIPVKEAAQQIDQSPSYITRLAQERWIDAYQVEGEWFVSLRSLSTFLLTAESDVYHHAKLAARRRKAFSELAAVRAREINRPGTTTIIVGQLSAIVLCAGLVAILGMSTLSAQLSWRDFQAGVIQTSVSITESIIVPIQDIRNQRHDVTMVSDTAPRVENYYPPVLSGWWAEFRSWLE